MDKRQEIIKSLGALWDENAVVEEITEDEEGTLWITLRVKRQSKPCPVCGTESDKVEHEYERIVQEIPIAGRPTFLIVKAHKYKCRNEKCTVKSFAEPLNFVHRSQKRTDALNALILAVSVYMGNRTAALVLQNMGIKVKHDAIRSLYGRIDYSALDDANVEEIGMDDIALRKGHKYATVFYDAQDGHLLGIVEGRDAQSVTAWLKDHPKIRRVARDRAKAYAKAIREALPNCVQVADRFHLLQNFMETVEEIMKEELPDRLYGLPNGEVSEERPAGQKTEAKDTIESLTDTSGLSYPDKPPVDADGKEIEVNADNRSRAASRERGKKKRNLIREVQAAYASGVTRPELSQRFHQSSGTIQRWLKMTEDEIDAFERRPEKKAWKYRNIIYRMMADGHKDAVIFSYLRANAGAEESAGLLVECIHRVSENHFPDRRITPASKIFRKSDLRTLKDGTVVLKRRDIIRCLLTVDPEQKKAQPAAKFLPAIRTKFPVTAWCEQAVQTFHAAVMGSQPEAVDAFIKEYEGSKLDSFCESLRDDLDAVHNGISMSLSSGFVEGNNNKVKAIKRIMYGRAELPFLQKKLMLAFAANRDLIDFRKAIQYRSRKDYLNEHRTDPVAT